MYKTNFNNKRIIEDVRIPYFKSYYRAITVKKKTDMLINGIELKIQK